MGGPVVVGVPGALSNDDVVVAHGIVGDGRLKNPEEDHPAAARMGPRRSPANLFLRARRLVGYLNPHADSG